MRVKITASWNDREVSVDLRRDEYRNMDGEIINGGDLAPLVHEAVLRLSEAAGIKNEMFGEN